MQHRDFNQVWPSLMQNLQAELAVEHSQRPLDIVFFCKSGKHRSVGLAWVLSKTLIPLGYNTELWHAMRELASGLLPRVPRLRCGLAGKMELVAAVIRKAATALPWAIGR